MNEFSAFRLFYDNFLYRNNVMIEYDKINKYLNNIIEVLKVATSIYHDNAKLYVANLTKYQSRIKKDLDKIMEIYPYFFEKYYELYARYEKNNNTVSDMPFVISCSFYNDYGYDNIKEDYVQRFTSLEKKRFRERSKKMSSIEYYKEALKDFDTDVYDNLINLLDNYINIDVRVDKTFEDNEKDYAKDIGRILTLNKRILEKARLNDDYNIIKEKMELVYKTCFNDFDAFLESELKNYLLSLYEKKKKYKTDFYDSILSNDLCYGIYKDFVSKEKKYKEKYDKIFSNKQVVNPNKIAIAPGLRTKLINIYYDDRFIFEETRNVNSLVEKINGLKSLAWDVEGLLWEQVLFNASHSAYLKRDNTVRYAIINTLYKFYSPSEILDRYDNVRNELLTYIENDSTLSNKLELKVIDYSHLPSKKDIMNNIYNKRIEFIMENSYDCISTKSKDYDTRDYDLFYIAKGLKKDDILNIYKELSKTNRFGKELIEYIAQCILLITSHNYSLSNIDYEMIADVARVELNTEYEIDIDDDIYVNRRDQYNMLYDSYLGNSAFNKLKGEYRL